MYDGQVKRYTKAAGGFREESNAGLDAKIQQLEMVPNIVINNAGLALVGSMVDIPTDRWSTMMQVNLLTPMRRQNSRMASGE